MWTSLQAGESQTACPWVDPDLACNNQTDNCQTVAADLINVIRACEEIRVNWTKVQECRQRPEEHPSDYWGRLQQALLTYGGMTVQNFNNELAASVFVAQATSDICSYFKDHMLGWQGKNLKDIILPGDSRLVQYVNNLFIDSEACKNCLKDTICLCTALAEKMATVHLLLSVRCVIRK